MILRVSLNQQKILFALPRKLFALVFLATLFVLVPQNVSAYGPYTNPTLVNIGSASNFVVLTKTGITSDYLSTFAGNIGVSPGPSATLTGVSCGNITKGRMYTTSPPSGPSGCITTTATAVADGSLLSSSNNDIANASADAKNQTTHPANEIAGASNISANGVKGRGVYNYAGAVSIDTDLTLRGSATDVWVFQVTGAKTQAAATKVIFQNEAGVVDGVNGPKASNIFWVISGAASQGANSHFAGTVFSGAAMSIGAGSTYNGRIFIDGTLTNATSDIYIITDEVVPPVSTDIDLTPGQVVGIVISFAIGLLIVWLIVRLYQPKGRR